MAEPAYLASDAVADFIHQHDPGLETFLISHNRYGEESCGWQF